MPTCKSRRVAIKLSFFEHYMAARGFATNIAVAKHLGCDEGTVSRIRNGQRDPGAAFIGCVATTCPDVPLREFFDFDAPPAGGDQ